MTFLVTKQGKPFTAAGFGGWFRNQCNEAELRQCSAHGLRKAAAVRHALNGATAPELMAWFGWKSITQAQRYIEAANRLRVSQSMGAKLISRTGIGSPASAGAKEAVSKKDTRDETGLWDPSCSRSIADQLMSVY